MPVTILSDNQISSLLHNLTVDEVSKLQSDLVSTLHDYSMGDESVASQPERLHTKTDYGAALFMPSIGRDTIGVKVVCINPNGSSQVNNPTSNNKSDDLPSTRPRGTLTLLDQSGMPKGWMSATTLTAFRTALATTFLMSKRSRVHNILVFGGGAQAYWHIRLALLLRGSDIHHVHIVSRTFATAETLLRTITTDPKWEGLRNAYKGGKENVEFTLLSSEFGEYHRVLKDRVRAADVIFGCTPSSEPLFPAEWLTSSEGRKKARYIGLVGSYKPGMMELHPDVLSHHVGKDQEGSPTSKKKWHLHKHVDRGGIVVVDNLEGSLKEAGEIIKAGLSGEHLVEVGELIMVRRKERAEAEIGDSQGDGQGDGQGDSSGLKKWVEGGNIIYKSVGVGLMDISVGTGVLELARAKGIGTTIEDF